MKRSRRLWFVTLQREPCFGAWERQSCPRMRRNVRRGALQGVRSFVRCRPEGLVCPHGGRNMYGGRGSNLVGGEGGTGCGTIAGTAAAGARDRLRCSHRQARARAQPSGAQRWRCAVCRPPRGRPGHAPPVRTPMTSSPPMSAARWKPLFVVCRCMEAFGFCEAVGSSCSDVRGARYS